MLGTNDAKACNWEGPQNGNPPGNGTFFRRDYATLVSSFQALNPRPKIYVALPIPLTGPPFYATMLPNVINEVFPVLQREIAKDVGADGVIDTWSALGGNNAPANQTCDGCHPKDAAMGVMAKTIGDYIQQANLTVTSW